MTVPDSKSGRKREFTNRIPETLVSAICEHIADRHSTLNENERLIISYAIILTYFYEDFRMIPYFYINAPMGAGKSAIADILRDCCFMARKTFPTVAALSVFHNPNDPSSDRTAIIDELHRLLSSRATDKDALACLFNLGYQPGNSWDVSAIGKPGTIEMRDPFFPKFLLGNGYNVLEPDTAQRTIQINATVGSVDDQYERARRQLTRPPNKMAEQIRTFLVNLATDNNLHNEIRNRSQNITPIQVAENHIIFNRDLDMWQPLIILADMTSDEYGKRMREIVSQRISEPEQLLSIDQHIDTAIRKLFLEKKLTAFSWRLGQSRAPLPNGQNWHMSNTEFGWPRPNASIRNRVGEVSLFFDPSKCEAELRFKTGDFNRVCEAIDWKRADVLESYRSAGRLIAQEDKNRKRSTIRSPFISGHGDTTIVIIKINTWLWPENTEDI